MTNVYERSKRPSPQMRSPHGHTAFRSAYGRHTTGDEASVSDALDKRLISGRLLSGRIRQTLKLCRAHAASLEGTENAHV